jgi:hypothetical protein
MTCPVPSVKAKTPRPADVSNSRPLFVDGGVTVQPSGVVDADTESRRGLGTGADDEVGGAEGRAAGDLGGGGRRIVAVAAAGGDEGGEEDRKHESRHAGPFTTVVTAGFAAVYACATIEICF